MCDGPKDIELLKKQHKRAWDNNIEIIEIKYISGAIHYRDRYSVGRILKKNEKRKYPEITE